MDNGNLHSKFESQVGEGQAKDGFCALDKFARVSKNFSRAAAFSFFAFSSDEALAELHLKLAYNMEQPARRILKCRQGSIERESYHVINAKTGEVVVDNGGDIKIQPASMTKLMTLLLTHEAEQDGFDSDKALYFSKTQKNSRSYDDLFGKWGGSIRVDDAKKAAALRSYNDAAFLLAENVAKFRGVGNTETHFVRLMNEKAKDIGMEDTFFYNSNGMPTPLVSGDGLGTTTSDMTILLKYIVDEYPDLAEILGEKEAIVRAGGDKIKITTSNSFLKSEGLPFDDSLGKTGATCNAGFAITMLADQGDESLIVSYVGGTSWRDREARVTDILQEGFDYIENEKIQQILMELF